MKLTRRETIVTGAVALVVASVGLPASADELSQCDAGAVDRELHLSMADGFKHQTWIYAGQTWSEARDALVLHEDERIRVVVVNDTGKTQDLDFGGQRFFRKIAAGASVTFAARIDRLTPFALETGVARIRAEVRPSYGAHAPVGI